jgi:2-polyprenyl-6-methoxyphenol hydroxylase-like FAD-dependent oxidoreductase
MLLAQKGYRVLVVDHASFPSDTLSTLWIHAPGIAALRRWGLLDEVVASGCPPIESATFDFGPVTISGTPRPTGGGSVAYAPRRTVLDAIRVDAARRAGAEVRERFTVEEIFVEDGEHVGLRGHEHGGRTVVERASVVVGADGRNSHVAKVAGASMYNEKPHLQWAYYTFWRGLPTNGVETYIRPDRGWAAIPTNDDLTLVVEGWPYAEAAAYKADIEANYLKTFELAPEFAERMRSATRVERFAGGSVLNFFRKPYGPGWALVGDAGYCKDPITAQGISDAFRDAESCAAALHHSLSGELSYEEAMSGYQFARDAHALPIYEFTTQMATLDPPPPEMQQLLAAIAGNQAGMDDFVSVIAGTLSPAEFFDPANIGRLMTLAGTAS